MAILNNSDVTHFEREYADDYLRPYVHSEDKGALQYAKDQYEHLLEQIDKGHDVPGVSREGCLLEISSLEKRIENK